MTDYSNGCGSLSASTLFFFLPRFTTAAVVCAALPCAVRRRPSIKVIIVYNDYRLLLTSLRTIVYYDRQLTTWGITDMARKRLQAGTLDSKATQAPVADASGGGPELLGVDEA